MINKIENNNLKPLTESQKWYYKKIMGLGKSKKVKQISYDELFSVLDRVKFCYFLSCLKEQDKIKMINTNERGYKNVKDKS